MPRYLLRAEGVNLSRFLEDTQDLSTVRGGSLALLEAVRGISGQAGIPATFEAVSVGASVGTFRFEAADSDEAARVRDGVVQALRNRPDGALSNALRHATVVLCYDEEQSDFLATRARLSARLRRKQLASATVIYPAIEPNPVDPTQSVCMIDLVRPVSVNERLFSIGGQVNPPISRSVSDRRRYGLTGKQILYERLLGLEPHDAQAESQPSRLEAATRIGPGHAETWARLRSHISGEAPFAFQLSSISEGSQRADDFMQYRLRTGLRDKICVIYADGTSFGKLQQDCVRGGNADGQISRQQDFDRRIQSWRRNLLAHLLNLMLDLGAYGTPSEDEQRGRSKRNKAQRDLRPWAVNAVMRFETLLWGGDELMFVLPARVGWRVVEAFLEETSTWALAAAGGETNRLHHGIGVVFCHNDAPIARIKDLAEGLTRASKTVTREDSLVLPVLLESFDHIGGAPALYFDRRTPPSLKGSIAAAPFVFNSTQWRDLRRAADGLLRPVSGADTAISRRALRHLAHAIHQLPSAPSKDLADLNSRGRSLMGETEFDIIYNNFRAHGVEPERFWILLDEFHDYLLPEREAAETGP